MRSLRATGDPVTKLFLAFALTALSGCATCREYPKTCVAVTAVAMGSLALMVHNTPHRSHDVTITPVSCTGGRCE